MKYVLLGIVAVIGLFAFAESLTCNTCPVGLVGICLRPSTTTCGTNTSVCTTSKASFSISGFLGFSSLNCLESAQCNATVSGTILGATYTIAQTCCNADQCNTLQSGASYVQVSITAVLSTALLACVWGQSVY
ncbi:lymphocyte antigen-6, epidermis [Tachysurus vachellii]|uniref:lymphocyte antigen-6, epidermis n=1 Tax=Tachysurus vachellii TaxID=175792 RepID=UPI00296A98B9|nr:lymphocyte antigen-6, epidermis [Tachysurus vachellii]